MRESFQDFYEQPPELAGAYLKRWYFLATHSRLAPIVTAAKTIQAHREGILRWFQTRVSNGVLKGINSLIQAAKAKAGGYRTLYNLMTMVYLVAGKLQFEL
jgi:transposase